MGALTQPDFSDLRPPLETTGASDDAFIQVTRTDGWAGLGLRYLDDARAWWAIAELSGILDPFEEFSEGDVLVSPSRSRFYFSLLEGAK
jgi:hypothetical protein